jgi:uncharacterized membrane-anchored protein
MRLIERKEEPALFLKLADFHFRDDKDSRMAKLPSGTLSKVPEVTLGFWVIKVLATTLGETGGDAVTMSMNLGYAIGSVIFIGIFAAAVVAQISANAFHPFLYWVTIIATTTLGTTMADFADRSLGVGYFGGSSILFAGLIASLAVWRWSEGSISVNTVATPRVEMFYWVAILFSQTLGTALGDWMADTNGLGYEVGAVVFAAGLAVVTAAYFYTKISHTLLFWAAFILTRPLGPRWAICSTSRLTKAASRSAAMSLQAFSWQSLLLSSSSSRNGQAYIRAVVSRRRKAAIYARA